MARKALSGMLAPDDPERLPQVTPQRIQDVVAARWGVQASGLASKRRTKDLTVPRQVAMYLIRELLDLPLVQVGYLFGGRDHSTVIHSVRKVEEAMAVDSVFQRDVLALKEKLTQNV